MLGRKELNPDIMRGKQCHSVCSWLGVSCCPPSAMPILRKRLGQFGWRLADVPRSLESCYMMVGGPQECARNSNARVTTGGSKQGTSIPRDKGNGVALNQATDLFIALRRSGNNRRSSFTRSVQGEVSLPPKLQDICKPHLTSLAPSGLPLFNVRSNTDIPSLCSLIQIFWTQG
jgi:hypothetical protein